MSRLAVVRTTRTVHEITVTSWNTRCGSCGWHTETREEPLARALANRHQCEASK